MSNGRARAGAPLARRRPARLVVLVHGYGEHIGRYEHVAQALDARGSAVVGPDHVGHGRSRGEPALVEDFEPVVDDLRAVVQDARGDLPVVMVGHSMGGLIATRYAQRHREDLAGLVLSGPAIGLGPVFEGWLAAPSCRRTRSTSPSSRATPPSARPTPPTRSSGTAAGSARRSRRSSPPTRRSPPARASATSRCSTSTARTTSSCPLALARPVVERLAGPDSELRVLDGARHEVFNELDKEETIALVADFAERLTR